MIQPMLCKSTKVPLTSTDYIVEQKFDGIRAILSVYPDKHYLETRTGQDVTHRFPDIVPIYDGTTYILDGEICHLVGDTTDFQAISSRIQRNANVDEYAAKYPATFIAFDCLMVEGISIMHYPLYERKLRIPWYKTSNILPAKQYGVELTQSMHPNWEGFIYKAMGSQYEEGVRSNSWLKYKFVKQEVVWVVGYTFGKGRRSGYFGALVAARRIDNYYNYAGSIGTGFTDLDLALITSSFKRVSHLSTLNRDNLCMSVSDICIEPFQVKVEYLEITKAGIMRLPSFKGYTNE